MMQDMQISFSLEQMSINLKGGKQAPIAPSPPTPMRLGKSAFWGFPLTPNKVRAEQGTEGRV